MSETDNSKHSSKERDSRAVTLLAPTPRDAKYCCEILLEHGIAVETATSIYDVARRIRTSAGVLLIAQEHLSKEGMDHLRLAAESQPSWSDIPILVLLSVGETAPRVVEDLLSLGNVTLMDRPLRIALLVSTLKAKLRDRARQYEVRDLLHKAEQASRSKSAFVANISHEIRTPMTSILGYAELMAGLVDNEEALGYLATIRRNGDFLLGIINDILDLSKIEAEKLDLDLEIFDPCAVVEDVRTAMDVRSREKGLTLEVVYACRLPRGIRSDAKRLRQILVNLVGNAIKFTSQGTVKIEVRFGGSTSPEAPETTAGGHLHFDISDSGIGMTPAQQMRLFQPFSQGDSLITQQFGGTGLGLAISQRLAKMLKGSISVTSEINLGSTFTLTLPTGDVATVPLVQPKVLYSNASNTQPKLDIRLDAHVLVVDDRRDIRFLSKRIVTAAGGQVTEAADGLLAIEAFQSASARGLTFDIVLLDLQMPNMDGYATARELRKLGYNNPIIALTADAMQSDMTKCIRAGCNYHISKPINSRELLQLLGDLTAARVSK